jgi:hypothetical protein
MDPSVPEDLIGDDVADAGDERLIHQGRFHLSASPPQQLQKLPAPDGKRVRPQGSQDLPDLVFIVAEPDPSELAHVAVAQLAASGETQRQAIVPVAFRLFSRPDQIAGHTKVQEERGPFGPADEPFPMTIGGPERLTPERLAECLRRCVPHDGGIR